MSITTARPVSGPKPPTGIAVRPRLGIIASSKYDRIKTGLVKDFDRLRTARAPLSGWAGVAVSDMMFTETGRLDNDAERDLLMGGAAWSNYRPNVAGIISEEDITLAWADFGWTLEASGFFELSKETYFREGTKKPYDPFQIVWVLVRDKETGVRVIKAGMHLPTQGSAPRRLEVWKDCGRGFARWCQKMTALYPDAFKDVKADWNAGFKNRNHVALLNEYYGKPSGLDFAWAAAGIGPKASVFPSSLIDGWLTDLPVVDVDILGGSWSYNDVKQSTHPPIWCAYLLWRGATPRPEPKPAPKPEPQPQPKPQPQPQPQPEPRSPAWDAIYEAAKTLRDATPTEATARREDLAEIMKRASKWSVTY